MSNDVIKKVICIATTNKKLLLNETYTSQKVNFYTGMVNRLYQIRTDNDHIGWFSEKDYEDSFVELSVFREQKIEQILI